MDRGHNREPVFADGEDRHAFLNLVARYQQPFGLRLYHYCLMTNHFHLLLQLDDPRRLSALMAGLLRAYVHHCARRHGFVGHLWQGRFKSPAIQCSTYLLSCGRYIERNPVEADVETMRPVAKVHLGAFLLSATPITTSIFRKLSAEMIPIQKWAEEPVM